MNAQREDDFAECRRRMLAEKHAALHELDGSAYVSRLRAAPARARSTGIRWSLILAASAAVAVLTIGSLAVLLRSKPLVDARTVEVALRSYAGGWASKSNEVASIPEYPQEIRDRAWLIQRLIYRARRIREGDDVQQVVLAALASIWSPAFADEPAPVVDVDRLGQRIETLRRNRGTLRLFAPLETAINPERRS